MSLVEPPIRPEDDPVSEVDDVIVRPVVPGPILAVKDVCFVCRRPVLQIADVWSHWDPRIDQVDSPVYHVAVLAVEEPVPWGHMVTAA